MENFHAFTMTPPPRVNDLSTDSDSLNIPQYSPAERCFELLIGSTLFVTERLSTRRNRISLEEEFARFCYVIGRSSRFAGHLRRTSEPG